VSVSPEEARRVFVRGVNWVGDAVMSTPALTRIRRAFPAAKITLHARPWVAAVYEHNPDIDELWVEDETSSPGAIYALARKIRAEHFDYGFVFPNSFRSAALLFLGGVTERIGNERRRMRPWERAFESRAFMLTRAIPLTSELLDRHEVYHYLNMVKWLPGGDEGEPRLVLNPGPEERRYVTGLLDRRGAASDALRVAVAPGSINSNAKRWLPDRFAAVADRLRREHGAEVYLLGSEAEREVLDEVERLCVEPVQNLGGELNLGQVIAFLELAHGFVGNDSGAMHLAAALETPSVAIFGPTRWVNTAPFSPLSVVVREPVECAPCMLRDCPIDHRCMTRIDVERVMKTFADLKAAVEGRRARMVPH
jgi:heptosyltransferase II